MVGDKRFLAKVTKESVNMQSLFLVFNIYYSLPISEIVSLQLDMQLLFLVFSEIVSLQLDKAGQWWGDQSCSSWYFLKLLVFNWIRPDNGGVIKDFKDFWLRLRRSQSTCFCHRLRIRK
ncbi:hypothetical protein PVL29_005375 [Vitis rotundifolia]|uniref:Uncharacterized protein n=1 Tax=Vitis rotundifolia TaxID=103349 RepID=A0AA39ABN4_VITRO|nr:hypothetical protein PVL29_005375 [Vitis rotundifolia]